jgi:hypothetical protein
MHQIQRVLFLKELQEKIGVNVTRRCQCGGWGGTGPPVPASQVPPQWPVFHSDFEELPKLEGLISPCMAVTCSAIEFMLRTPVPPGDPAVAVAVS